MGKTEIARRLAKLVRAPFVKVEATKFTEVGYVGRDVDGMVRDLVDAAVRMVEQEKMAKVEYQAEELANLRLLEALGLVPAPRRFRRAPIPFPFGREMEEPVSGDDEEEERLERLRRHYLLRMKAGEFDDEEVEIEVEEETVPFFVNVLGPQGMEQVGFDPADLLGSLFPKRKRKRRMKVKDARRVLTQEEAQKLIDRDEVVREAIRRAEEDGIIFIDEMDKIAGRERGYGPDVSLHLVAPNPCGQRKAMAVKGLTVSLFSAASFLLRFVGKLWLLAGLGEVDEEDAEEVEGDDGTCQQRHVHRVNGGRDNGGEGENRHDRMAPVAHQPSSTDDPQLAQKQHHQRHLKEDAASGSDFGNRPKVLAGKVQHLQADARIVHFRQPHLEHKEGSNRDEVIGEENAPCKQEQ